MKTLSISLIALLIGSAFTACRTSAILNATFESDDVGALPSRNPAGDPTGDEVTYDRALESRLRVQASATASEKALHFSQVPASGLTAHNQFVGFRGTSTNFAQPLYFFFTATHRGFGGNITIDVSDGTAKLIARMYIDANGQVSIVRRLAPEERETIGTIPLDASHTIVFSVRMSTSTYNVTIFKSGGNLTATDKPVLLGSGLEYSNPARPTISFRFGDGNSDTRKYILEGVYISREMPRMQQTTYAPYYQTF